MKIRYLIHFSLNVTDMQYFMILINIANASNHSNLDNSCFRDDRKYRHVVFLTETLIWRMICICHDRQWPKYRLDTRMIYSVGYPISEN